MSFVKRLWKDRISQYPNRRTINDGYVTKQVTVGRDEGTVTEQGDAFNASNMNDLEDRIYAAIEQGGGGGGGGTYDYSELTNKPQVNGNELSGNKTTTNLGIYGSNTQMSAVDTTKVADRIIDLEETTCSVVKGSTMPTGFPLPTINRRGKVVTVNFAVQFPAGTYSNADALWVLTPKPVSTVRVLLTTGVLDLMNFTTDGNVKFNSNKTFNSATWVIGNFTYLTS